MDLQRGLKDLRLGTVVALSAFLLTVPWTTTEAAVAPVKGKASAASKRPSSSQKPSNQGASKDPLTSKSFSASGLTNEDTLTALFRGDFAKIGIGRDDQTFEALFQEYLNVYAHRCSAHLPANKVEMTTQVCANEQITTNGFGVEMSRTCLNYEDKGTGLYADPDLYAAKKALDRLIATNNFRQVGRLLQGGQEGLTAGIMSMARIAQTSASDMIALFQMNACSSPGLKRFENNLRLFALNKQPIRLEGGTEPSPVTASVPGNAFRDHNYTRLVEDLVADNVQVTEVSVSSRDAEGRPTMIVASYIYDGFSGRHQASVSVHFTDGTPDCLYYSGAPTTCRTPNWRVAAAYAAGAYEYGY